MPNQPTSPHASGTSCIAIILSLTRARKQHSLAVCQRLITAVVILLIASVNSASGGYDDVCLFDWTPHEGRPKRVYDTVIFNGEEDMLVVRLHTLQDVVDWFVIVESHQTFQGNAKELHFEKALPRLGEALRHKVIYVVLSEITGDGPWEREHFHRRSIFTRGLTHPGKEVYNGDIVVMSDLDEIPKPDVLAALKGSSGFPHLVSLQCPLCYYSYANVGRVWNALKVVTWTDGLDGQDVRSAVPDCMIPSSCWHCSYCFSSISAVQNKLTSYSHTEYSGLPYTDPEHIVNHTRSGHDLLDRSDMPFAHNAAPDAPAYVKASSRLQYLVDRDRPDAGYIDL